MVHKVLPVWKTNYRIQALDADHVSLAKVSALCNYFQESAGHHAEHLGVGSAILFNKGLVWVLARLRIQIEAYPTWGEEILLETWPAGIDGLFAMRNFAILRSNNLKIVKGTSAWLVLDKETRRPFRGLPSLLNNIPENPLSSLATFEIPRLKPARELTKTGTLTAQYSDLDANGHVNNNRYIEWLSNAFDAQWYQAKRIQDLTIYFMSEIHAGDILNIFKTPTGKDIWRIEGHSGQNNEVVFTSQATFADYF